MFRIENITRDWKEAGSFAAQLNLYGFWDEHSFLTKTGDLGVVLKVGGIDYESLDHAGRDYAVKRLEAALRSPRRQDAPVPDPVQAQPAGDLICRVRRPSRPRSRRTARRVSPVEIRSALFHRDLLDRHGGRKLRKN